MKKNKITDADKKAFESACETAGLPKPRFDKERTSGNIIIKHPNGTPLGKITLLEKGNVVLVQERGESANSRFSKIGPLKKDLLGKNTSRRRHSNFVRESLSEKSLEAIKKEIIAYVENVSLKKS